MTERPAKQRRTDTDQAVHASSSCPCCAGAWRGTGLLPTGGSSTVRVSAAPATDDRAAASAAAAAAKPRSGEHFGEFFVLRGARVYSLVDSRLDAETNEDEDLVLDVWVGGGKILAMSPHAATGVCPNVPGIVEIDVTGLTIVPGFVDCHVHVTGGGGEAGFASRTPEAQQGELINAGVTSFVAVLGTDTVTRGSENLLAKTRGLAACGLTGYAWLGGYQFPPLNDLTGSMARDITLIPEAIGTQTPTPPGSSLLASLSHGSLVVVAG